MDKILVDMPTKKIYRQNRYNDKIYVYFITKAHRNKNGKPTSSSIMIGMEDKKTGKLIPNDNFFKIYDCEITIKVKGIKDYE